MERLELKELKKTSLEELKKMKDKPTFIEVVRYDTFEHSGIQKIRIDSYYYDEEEKDYLENQDDEYAYSLGLFESFEEETSIIYQDLEFYIGYYNGRRYINRPILSAIHFLD